MILPHAGIILPGDALETITAGSVFTLPSQNQSKKLLPLPDILRNRWKTAPGGAIATLPSPGFTAIRPLGPNSDGKSVLMGFVRGPAPHCPFCNVRIGVESMFCMAGARKTRSIDQPVERNEIRGIENPVEADDCGCLHVTSEC